MKSLLKNISFFAVLALLFIPLAYQLPKYKDSIQPLTGAFPKIDTLEFNTDNWFNKSWQENRSEIQKNNMNLRPLLVRIKHQIDYSIFKELHISDLLIGKDDYLFSHTWANSRASEHELNKDSLSLYLNKLKILSEVLEKKGKYFQIIIPPSKEEIFSDKLPNKFATENEINDYHYYTKSLQENNLKYWDLLDYYRSIMDTSFYPVYSKSSVHWTKYGAHFTLLKLLDDMNHQLKGNMATLHMKELKISKFSGGDGDYATTLNLLRDIDTIDFAYPIYTVNDTSKNLIKPKVLTIGDSYYWAMKGSWQLPRIYSEDSKYLYYYNTVYYNGTQPSHGIQELDIVEEFKTCNAVVILNSAHNLIGYPFGLQHDIDKIISGLKELPDAN
jgi:hypothetical protein